MQRLIPFLLALLIIQANAAPEDPEKVCMEIEQIDPHEAVTIFRRNLPDLENQTNQKLKCYAACMLEKINVMDGCSYQLELGKQYAMEKETDELLVALDECKDSSSGSERCDCGYNVFKCIYKSLGKSENNGN